MIVIRQYHFEFRVRIDYPFQLQGDVQGVLEDQWSLQDARFKDRRVVHFTFGGGNYR